MAILSGAGSYRFWRLIALSLFGSASIALSAGAHAGPINMNQLFTFPGSPVTIAADGSSATLSEDPSLFSVILSDVPGFGDPELLVASAGATLAFDYDFQMPAGNVDVFHFALLDGLTGFVLPGEELFANSSAAGSALFDLTPLVGTTLGLQFEMVSDLGDAALSSFLTISNLRVDTPAEPPPVGVPEPSVLALFSAALLVPLMRARRRMHRP